MGLRKRLFAALYDRLGGEEEEWETGCRQETAGAATGEVLEIGGGTGANLDFFAPDVRLTVAEPNPHMARRLEEKATSLDRDVAVVAQVAENLPFPDETFDSVVSTLVLCSISDLGGSLAEVFRVLKQDGAFYFYEHVAASTGRSRTLQGLLNRPNRLIAGGCNLNRDVAHALRTSDFSSVDVREFLAPSGPGIFKPRVVGVARKQAKA